MNRVLILACAFLLHLNVFAQVEMADNFRGEGKIYVVIGIILLIILGFFALLFKLDRSTKRLEEKHKK